MRKLLLFTLLLISQQIFAGNIYVSNVASNGTIVGTDGGACNTIGAPCLTYAGAQTAASASDTILCNGIFTMTNGITLSKALTTNPLAAGSCTLAMSASNANVIQFSASQTFGAITINGTNSTSAPLKPSALSLSLTLNGTTISNCPTHCIDGSVAGRILTATWDGVTMSSTGTGATSCFLLIPNGAATYTITNSTFRVASMGNLAGCATFTPSVTGLNLTFSGNRIDVVANSGAANTKCFYASGVSSLDVYNNTCTTGGTTTTPEGFNIVGHATIAVSHAWVYNNTISSSISSTSLTDGHGVQIGDETNLASATITSPLIYGNTVTGLNHAIYCGYATTSCQMLRNYIIDSVIGVIQEGGSAAIAQGNIIKLGALTGGGLRSRHGINNRFEHNTVIMDASVNATAKWFETDDSDSGTTFKNNSFSNINGTVPADAALVSSGLTAVFGNNAYWSSSYAAGAFNNGTTAYNSASTWKAANDTNAVITNPLFIGGTTNSTAYQLSSSSPLRRTGVDLNVGNIQDFGNRAFMHPPSIGAWEAASRDVAATRSNP